MTVAGESLLSLYRILTLYNSCFYNIAIPRYKPNVCLSMWYCFHSGSSSINLWSASWIYTADIFHSAHYTIITYHFPAFSCSILFSSRLCCLPVGGVHVKMKYQLGSVLVVMQFVRPLGGRPGTAGALPLETVYSYNYLGLLLTSFCPVEDTLHCSKVRQQIGML